MAIRVAATAALALLVVAMLAAPRPDVVAAAGVTITSITPAQGPAHNKLTVTIKGTGFPLLDDCQDAFIEVTFGGMAAFTVAPPTRTEVKVRVPELPAGLVDVVVKNPCDGTSATVENGYRYVAPGITSGEIPDSGFGLFVFGGGTNDELVEAGDCDADTLRFWATDASGAFVTFIPGSAVSAVNEEWNDLFDEGIAPNTALIGRCT